MAKRKLRFRATALFLAALIFGFAPLVHSMCVGEAVSVSQHVMTDGTLMATDVSQHDADHTDEGILLGLIALTLAPAFLALRRLWRYFKQLLSAPQLTNRLDRRLDCKPPKILHRPTMVDLTSLGISRT